MQAAERGARLDGDRRLLQVEDVLRAVQDQFHIAFSRRIWVLGTLRGLHEDDGERFFLTGLGPDDDDAAAGAHPPSTLPCLLPSVTRDDIDDSLRRLHDVAVDDLLVEGYLIRAGGLLGYDAARHTLVFTVTALDPAPTSSWLQARRSAVRDAVAVARLSERQRDVQVPIAPRSVALVGATADPGLHAAEAALLSSGLNLTPQVYSVDVSGVGGPDALAAVVREATLAGHDVVLLVREAGRPLGLAPYDTEPVVRAIASAPVAVLTGLGAGEGPLAVEEVAHQACPTAQEAARAVLRRLQRADELVEHTVGRIAEAGEDALRAAARRVEETRQAVREAARLARVRTERQRARRLLRLRLVALAIGVAILLTGAVTQTWLLLAALLLPLGLGLFAQRLRPRRRGGPVAVSELSFDAALQRLGQIQREMQQVQDPDDVMRLEEDAALLAEHCRALLRRPRPLRSSGGESPATHEQRLVSPPAAPARHEALHVHPPVTEAGEPADATRARPTPGSRHTPPGMVTAPAPRPAPAGPLQPARGDDARDEATSRTQMIVLPGAEGDESAPAGGQSG